MTTRKAAWTLQYSTKTVWAQPNWYVDRERRKYQWGVGFRWKKPDWNSIWNSEYSKPRAWC